MVAVLQKTVFNLFRIILMNLTSAVDVTQSYLDYLYYEGLYQHTVKVVLNRNLNRLIYPS